MFLRMFNNCFICGTPRSILELQGDGFIKHVLTQHSLYAYVTFLVYIREKPLDRCNGVERYVKDKLKVFSVEFFPTSSRFIKYEHEVK